MSKIDDAMTPEMQRFFYEQGPEQAEAILKQKKARQKKADRATKKYMKSVRAFLESKNGGIIPPEWEMSLNMLEIYYTQWLLITYTIQDSGEYTTINSVGNLVEHPLIGSQNKAATRLEKQISEMGLSMKSGKKLEVVEPKKNESELDKFFKSKVEVR